MARMRRKLGSKYSKVGGNDGVAAATAKVAPLKMKAVVFKQR